jgi:hypothetical protein
MQYSTITFKLLLTGSKSIQFLKKNPLIWVVWHSFRTWNALFSVLYIIK